MKYLIHREDVHVRTPIMDVNNISHVRLNIVLTTVGHGVPTTLVTSGDYILETIDYKNPTYQEHELRDMNLYDIIIGVPEEKLLEYEALNAANEKNEDNND